MGEIKAEGHKWMQQSIDSYSYPFHSMSIGSPIPVWVIKFNGLSGDSGQRGPYSPYKPCNHSLYIGIIIFPQIDNPQSTGHNLL